MDEVDSCTGRGWAVFEGDELHGIIFFHQGDESGFVAQRTTKKAMKRKGSTQTMTTISINRAPLLTMWAVVVAKRLGFDEDEALTLGKTLAGWNAQVKVYQGSALATISLVGVQIWETTNA